MAYCVNCGVELAPSERACPLCETVVVHPAKPFVEPSEYPYPPDFEQVGKVNHRYGAYLATIVLAIPMVLAALLNLFDNNPVPWSLYVMGACACLFVLVLLPFYVDWQRPYFFLTVDAAAIGLYLVLIGHLTGGDMRWVWTLALPLVLTLYLGVMLATYLGRRPGKKILNLLSDIALIVGGMTIVTELLVDLFLWPGAAQLNWSLYALVPLAAVAILFRVIERHEKLKSNIFRRLFV